MKKLTWRSMLAWLAVLLVLAGVTPLLFVLAYGYSHNPEALSASVSLQPGEYVSPFFTTDLKDDYQIDIDDLPPLRTTLDMDWKVEDQTGALMDGGTYRDEPRVGGNEAILDRYYRPKRRTRQRVILQIHRGLQKAEGLDVKLHVGVPERGLQQAYAFAAALILLPVLAGPGTGILLVLLILRLLRNPKVAEAGPRTNQSVE